MEHLTLRRAKNLVDEVIADHGEDYRYGGDGADCAYFDDSNKETKPLCLVGHVLHRAGINPLELIDSLNNRETFPSVVQDLGLPVDDDARDFLRVAQVSQDSGRTWGTARSQANAGLAV